VFFSSYLLNPYTVLSCVAKSTCAINNTLIAFFILTTIKGKAFQKNIRDAGFYYTHAQADTIAHTYYHIWEAETEGSGIQGQPLLYSKNLSQKEKKYI